MSWDSTCDVVVVGSGGAALAGALAAVHRGLTVCVLEKTDRFGGTSAYSGGSVWLPGNHVLARQGVDDSVEKGLTYFSALVGERTRSEVQRAYLETGPVVADFLENAIGIPLEHRPFPDYFDAPGRSAGGRSIFARAISAEEVGDRLGDIRPMVPADQFGVEMDRSVLDGGQAWIARMILALDAADRAELKLSTPVTGLVQDEQGQVIGVVVTEPDGIRTRIRARAGVLLAAGGFERSPELRAKWQDMPSADWTSSHPDTGSGDALALAESVGAATDLLDQSWWCPATLFPNGHAAFTLGVRAGIIVDGTGQRFADEMLPYDRMGRAMRERMRLGHGEAFWFVFDDRSGDDMPAICVPPPSRAELSAAGLWHTADDLVDLAAAIGVDAEQLTATVHRFNGFSEQGRDEDFHRGEDPFGRFFVGAASAQPCLLPLNGARFHAVRLVLGDLGTKGGAVIGREGAVERADGSVIPGLYAAGNAAASVAGPVYPGPGVPLGSGMVMAYRAVADMADRLGIADATAS
ncbi:FAD-dependent oxidoreductase [Nocardia higoensis]|uniref:FAD-dependent oxidoreductase n=1 Tax=Nocardia higoensis TaxID=228599 RepID=A0ABS0D3P5_9NOCA|nr:FAD-dependent oxidoreductase [Nocardia higoensis]MBF6353091.1 FAD-dependent oxidoreductase [Nocardia higoensis]